MLLPLLIARARRLPRPPADAPRRSPIQATRIQRHGSTAHATVAWRCSRSAGRWRETSAGPPGRPSCGAWTPRPPGTVGFLMRLVTIAITLAGRAAASPALEPQTLAVGGAFTAVVVGLAAQQTLGNVIAGMVLLSARPFRVGERVRLQAGAVGGHGRGHGQLAGPAVHDARAGDDRILIPNNVVLAAAVVPLRSPTRSTSGSGSAPECGRARCRRSSTRRSRTPTRQPAASCSRRSTATTSSSACRRRRSCADDGAELADEIIAALSVGDRRARDRARRALRPRARVRPALGSWRWRSASVGGDLDVSPAAAAPLPPGPARARPIVVPSRSGERGHVELGAVLLDRPDHRRGDVGRACASPTPRRQRDAGLGEHAGVADEAGETTETPDAVRPRGPGGVPARTRAARTSSRSRSRRRARPPCPPARR